MRRKGRNEKKGKKSRSKKAGRRRRGQEERMEPIKDLGFVVMHMIVQNAIDAISDSQLEEFFTASTLIV